MAEWYYTANGQQAGPVDLQTLRQMLDGGAVSHSELVYGPGLTQWTPANKVPTLAGAGSTNVQGNVPTSPTIGAASMIGYRGIETETTGLSAVAMNALRGTKPWVRFISIMTFIGAGLMGLAGIAMIVVGAIARRGTLPVAGWLGGVYIALAAIYVVPGILLTRFANSIGNLMRTQRNSDVDQAMNAQRSFWKVSGIMMIIVMGLYVVGAVVAAIVGAMR